MKLKAIFLISCISAMLLALGVNYYGHQSIVNLGTTSLFTAPASGIYFVSGTLSLPQLSTGGAPSSAVAQVSKNGVTLLYNGVAGASGFGIPSVALVSNDSISVSVTSNATVDQGLNKIKGDVFFGSNF